jgi:hypothetical protein
MFVLRMKIGGVQAFRTIPFRLTLYFVIQTKEGSYQYEPEDASCVGMTKKDFSRENISLFGCKFFEDVTFNCDIKDLKCRPSGALLKNQMFSTRMPLLRS